MSQPKPSPKNQKKLSKQRSPHAARQNSLVPYHNQNVANEAGARPGTSHSLQGLQVHHHQQQLPPQQRNPQWPVNIPQMRIPNENSSPVDLLVSNLDFTIDATEIVHMLLNMFQQYCTILKLTVNVQGINNLVGNIRVANSQEAQAAISRLNFRWLGCRQITVSYLYTNIEQFLASPFRIFNYFCPIHCPNGLVSSNFGEPIDLTLPNVRISFNYFQNQVQHLLIQHMGYMPLLSFPICYAFYFKQLLPANDTGGVPLEYLISCLPMVEIIVNEQNRNLKYLKLKDPQNIRTISIENVLVNSIPSDYLDNVIILCQEIMELLTNSENCQMFLNFFLPTYYRYFGRLCQATDYGFNQLAELFDAISNVVQVLGYGSKQIMMLTHAVQIRRFTMDLLRVLKSQKSRKLSVVRFSRVYEQIFFKLFNPVEYGLCSLEDLLCCIQEGAVVFSKVNDIDVVSIPQPSQTAEEKKRTEQFAYEVKEILQHFPYCIMPFDKFLPTYRYYTGREFKLSDYGFKTLIELFEAIPDTVEISGFFNMHRNICLTLEPLLEVLGIQLMTLIVRSNLSTLQFEEIKKIYRSKFGYDIQPERYHCGTLLDVFIKLNEFIQVHFTRSGPLVSAVVVDKEVLELRLWALLLYPPHQMELNYLKYLYRIRFESNLPKTKLQQLEFVEIKKYEDNIVVSLTAFHILAARFYHLLANKEGSTPVRDLVIMYIKKYGVPIYPNDYGFPSLLELFHQMNYLIIVNVRDRVSYVNLNENLSDYGVRILKQRPDHFIWLPSPLHLLVRKSTIVTPPKPETPPLPGYWDDAWNYSPESLDQFINLQISLPGDINVDNQSNISHDSSIRHTSDNRTYNNGGLDDSGYSGFNVSRQDSSIHSASTSQIQQFVPGTSNMNFFNMPFNRSM